MAQEGLKPLSPDELTDLLQVEGDVVLVAGQALALWADLYQIVPPTALEAGVTYDLDFLGTSAQAKRHHKVLEVKFHEQVKIVVASMDDATPNSAVIAVHHLNGRREPILLDYLAMLKGYDENDERRLRAIAVRANIHGRDVLVMHPFDCLKSRVHNFATLPGKKNEMGSAQLHLSIAVMRAHLRSLSADEHRPVGLKLAEKVFALALSDDGRAVWREHRIELLDAIPVDVFCEQFRLRRWPQFRGYLARKRGGEAPAEQSPS